MTIRIGHAAILLVRFEVLELWRRPSLRCRLLHSCHRSIRTWPFHKLVKSLYDVCPVADFPDPEIGAMMWTRRISIFLLLLVFLTACSSKESEPTSGLTRAQDVRIFFVGDTPRGFRLFPEVQTINVYGDLTNSVMNSLVSGELQPLDPDYRNLWGSGSKLNSITINAGLATIDLALGELRVGAEGELRAIDQLVWTVTEINRAITGVKFTVDGKTVESLAGHVDTTGTFKRAPDYEVLNPIAIISPAHGAALANPIVITGEACTFEANVAWEIIKDGVSIGSGATTALSACPDRSPWTLDLDNLAIGSYTIIAREYSAEDGSLTSIDSRDFTVA